MPLYAKDPGRSADHPTRPWGRLLKVPEVAELLTVSPDTVERYVDQGQIGSVRIGPRSIRIPEAAVQAFLTERTRLADAKLDRRGRPRKSA